MLHIPPFDIAIDENLFWLIVGFIGLLLFTLRFMAQWLASARMQKAVIPMSFWYCGAGGTLILLLYAIYRQDPVFIVGQTMAFIVYMRNIVYIARNPRAHD